MTSRQVECGKTENGPSHQSTAPHARWSTRNTNISPHVVSVPRYRRRSMCSVAVFAPSRPSLWVRTLQCRTATQPCGALIPLSSLKWVQPAHSGLMVILFAAGPPIPSVPMKSSTSSLVQRSKPLEVLHCASMVKSTTNRMGCFIQLQWLLKHRIGVNSVALGK